MSVQPHYGRGRQNSEDPNSPRDYNKGLPLTVEKADGIIKQDNGIVRPKASPVYGSSKLVDIPIKPANMQYEIGPQPAYKTDGVPENEIWYFVKLGYSPEEISKQTGYTKPFIENIIEQDEFIRKTVARDPAFKSMLGIKRIDGNGIKFSVPLTFSNVVQWLQNKNYGRKEIIHFFSKFMSRVEASEIVDSNLQTVIC